MRVRRIVHRHSVDRELVHVDIRLQHVGCAFPNALFVLLHGDALADAGKENRRRVRRAQPDRHLAINGDLRRFDWRRGSAAPRGCGLPEKRRHGA
jgi:hypothetical protein